MVQESGADVTGSPSWRRLLVEQSARAAPEVAEVACAIENGRVVQRGATAESRAYENIRKCRLGLSVASWKKSSRAVTRRKRCKRRTHCKRRLD